MWEIDRGGLASRRHPYYSVTHEWRKIARISKYEIASALYIKMGTERIYIDNRPIMHKHKDVRRMATIIKRSLTSKPPLAGFSNLSSFEVLLINMRGHKLS